MRPQPVTRRRVVARTCLFFLLGGSALAAALGTEAVNPPRPVDPDPPDIPVSVEKPGEYPNYNERQRLVTRGMSVYAENCIGCHGEKGDGNGPAAQRLIIKPRDFTKGIFKFRSTDSGSLPLESDLARTITRGLARVSMPAFPLMPEPDKAAVIEYVKHFYPRWDQEAAQRVVLFIPQAPTDLDSPQRIGRGRVVYLAMGCGNCHGGDGAGKGATQTEYTDAWGRPIKPLNFTRGRLKGGSDPEDVYRTFQSGLRSVMPSFGGTTTAMVMQKSALAQDKFFQPGEPQSLKPFLADFPADKLPTTDLETTAQRNSWDLVAYVLSLRHGPQAGATTRPSAK